MSDQLLSEVSGSAMPAPVVATVAVLVKVPVAVVRTVAVSVYVTLPPDWMLTTRLMLPLALVTLPQDEPAVAVHVQWAFIRLPFGTLSVTRAALVALAGPAFDATMV